MKQYKFLISTLTVAMLSLIAIYISYSMGYVTKENQTILKNTLPFLLCISFFFIGWYEIGMPRLKKSLFNHRNLLLFSLVTLLVSSINQRVGIFATAFFVLSAFIYFLFEKKWYKLNTVYYAVFLFGLLHFLGTIGTVEGFRFPDKLLSFFILPLAFSCFRFKKETYLRVLRLFFRIIFVYLIFAVIYAWYNKLFYSLDFFEWITSKLAVEGEPIYFWVLGWTHYAHPSYVSLVLIAALLSGFYLYYKKTSATIGKLELFAFSVFFMLTVLLTESRIGFVCGILVFGSTALYYLFLSKRNWFRIAFICAVLTTGIGIYLLDDPISMFVKDDVRKTDYTLAINYIKSHPWWGSGYNEQDLALAEQAEIMKDVLPLLPHEKTYTHNQFLGEMVQFGVWGLIVLLILLFSLFRYAVFSKSYLLQIFLLVCLVYMMVEEPLTGQGGITRVMVFLSLFIHLSEDKKYFPQEREENDSN